MVDAYLPGIGEEPQLPSQDELRKVFNFYFGSVYKGIDPKDPLALKKQYESAYKALTALLSKGSKIEPMPTSPENLPEPTKDDLAEVEASCGIYVVALVGCVRGMASVFLQ
ncbi:MAG: hypothetical protein WC848_05400 [Parcubacteria group bacterium]|jgi:hypothetical protein